MGHLVHGDVWTSKPFIDLLIIHEAECDGRGGNQQMCVCL